MEGSFAAAANHHGFKRARWRRLHNQRIQDYLIAACQNIRIFMRNGRLKPAAAMAAVENDPVTAFYALVVLAQHPSNFRTISTQNCWQSLANPGVSLGPITLLMQRTLNEEKGVEQQPRKGGVAARSRKYRAASLFRADGVVAHTPVFQNAIRKYGW
jgi:hypothetical protein